MRCPSCLHPASKVVDSRPGSEGQEIRRRRECEGCQHRFTTYERCELIVPLVIKRDGRREELERDKLRRALRTACRKRSISAETIEDIVDRVANELLSAAAREVSSAEIGERLLQELAAIDEVAYARFASVYLRFESLDEFRDLAVSNKRQSSPGSKQ
ncbi:MAG: transcriptional regulator NrdR [Rickettsiales bacterium]|nr:transcriptional regulator NrdR [Rickettsiales bacterium]|tara:strand:- start:249 stop:722 length:474 start_codon:yes stop_codon:yes gene_type:complete